MTAYKGGSLYVSFAGDSGTVTLSTDFTQLTTTQSIALLDQSAGADTNRTYVNSLKDETVAVTFKQQSGGTTLPNALASGASGTLTWGEQGTSASSPKHELPCISQGAAMNIPFDNLVEISCTFQGNGARVDSTY